tara:strand:- start:430 stop:675 length:246 start_codon:yes stop_codon:yes gene_type:complete
MSNIDHASIVNLISKETILPEYLQNKMTPKNLAEALEPLLDISSDIRKNMLDKFDILHKNLGEPGVYKRAAEAIVSRNNKA